MATQNSQANLFNVSNEHFKNFQETIKNFITELFFFLIRMKEEWQELNNGYEIVNKVCLSELK